jgi:anaerobic selenocysteine-containing dehydrogenase
MTRTAKAKQLWRRDSEPFVQIHPLLAERLQIAEGELVQITSRRGTLHLKAAITDRVPADTVFVPLHWGDLFAPGNAVNYLTISAIGRVAKQPELKHCAVAVEKSVVVNNDWHSNGQTVHGSAKNGKPAAATPRFTLQKKS